jgi:Protein of unknown function (DUF4013)
MRPLSATECISPAIERTKLILFSPFRWGRTWKLSATAYVCCLGSMFFPFPLIYLCFLPAVRTAVGTRGAVALVAGVLIFTALFTWIFHLCSRLQFAYFDIVVNRGEFVAPAWRKYGPRSLRWTGFKIALGAAATLVCALPIAAYIRHLLPLLTSMQTLPPGQPPSPQFIGAIFAGYGLVMLVIGFFFLISSLLANFVVPSLALEDPGIKEAFRRMAELIRREPGEFAIYTVLKIALGFAGYMGATIAWEIVFIICTLIVMLVGYLIGLLFHLAGIPTVVLTVLACVLGGGWYLFSFVYSLLLTIGPLFTFLDAYALYFLGGRYPMLGNLLDQSTPLPSALPLYPIAYSAYPPPPLDFTE